MMCLECNQETATARFSHGKWICHKCLETPMPYLPDTYFRGTYFEEHFATDKSPHGQWVTSKRSKSKIMKDLGIREGGDRQHGAR